MDLPGFSLGQNLGFEKWAYGSSQDIQAFLAKTESSIARSINHLNELNILLGVFHDHQVTSDTKGHVAVTLCRIFCRLLDPEHAHAIRETRHRSAIFEWILQKLSEYRSALKHEIGEGQSQYELQAWKLLLEIMLLDSVPLHLKSCATPTKSGIHYVLLQLVAENETDPGNDRLMAIFLDFYLTQYADVQIACLSWFSKFLDRSRSTHQVQVALEILSSIESHTELTATHCAWPENVRSSTPARKLEKLRQKSAQEAWQRLLTQPLSQKQHSLLLGLIAEGRGPYVGKSELLVDYVTEIFGLGGSLSIAALSTLLSLIRDKNIDFAQIYVRAYPLLNSAMLVSNQRARLIRLLDQLLSSSHLSANLVASFIKRSSRLALSAPPAALVVLVPFVYNLLKRHPECSYMVHRTEWSDSDQLAIEDPFRMQEPDPSKTGALQSSLWELETMQHHYHPNAASIARIISEQFTKQSWDLEDFLNHSYTTMIKIDLNRTVKRLPTIEYNIPQHIWDFEDKNQETSDLQNLWRFGQSNPRVVF